MPRLSLSSIWKHEPKSMILTIGLSSINEIVIFSGLISQCTNPHEWIAYNPSSTPLIISLNIIGLVEII